MASEKDRFDALPRTRGRVGAHRGPRTRGFGWLWFLVALVAAALLALGGLYAYPILTGDQIDIPWLPKATPTSTSTSTSAPDEITDPTQLDPARGIQIIILNGTPTAGLQDQLAQQLKDGGWPVLSTANSGDRNQLDTIVYVSNPTDIDVARGLVKVLGYGDIRIVDPNQYPGAAVTIVLGEDSPLYPKPSGAPTGGSKGP